MPPTTFFIKRPTAVRRTFALVKRDVVAGKRRHTTISLPEINSINEHYSNGRIDHVEAFQMLKKVKAALYKDRDKCLPKAVFASVNLRIKDDYFALQRKLKQNKDWTSLKNEITRAVEACGEHSLISTSNVALQEQINAKFEDDSNKQRRIVSRLNSILKFLNRDNRLVRAPEDFKEIKHLTERQVLEAVPKVADPLEQLLIKVAFYTGCRLGECFALTPEHLRSNFVFVAWQIDEEYRRRETKNRKRRNAYVIPNGRDAVKEWVSVPIDGRLKIRNARHASILSNAVGDDSIVFHSLRHSYAYELAMRGADLSTISRNLGNSIAVAERYYLGWVQEERGMETLDRFFRAFKNEVEERHIV